MSGLSLSGHGELELIERCSEQSQPQFKVEIKNDVIHEEEGEADAALSKVTSTLRAVRSSRNP